MQHAGQRLGAREACHTYMAAASGAATGGLKGGKHSETEEKASCVRDSATLSAGGVAVLSYETELHRKYEGEEIASTLAVRNRAEARKIEVVLDQPRCRKNEKSRQRPRKRQPDVAGAASHRCRIWRKSVQIKNCPKKSIRLEVPEHDDTRVL